jgi:hypothetical protein
MSKMWSRRPSPALIVATVALVVAMAGTTYAATQLPKNSVGAKQLKSNAVTTAKIKNGAVTGPKVNLASLGTVPSATTAATAGSAGSAASAANASALGGSPPSAFASSSVIRSATVDDVGNLVPALSDGVSNNNFLLTGTGIFCIKGLNPAPKTAVATVSGAAEQGSTVATDIGAPGEECQVTISTYDKSATDKREPFSVLIH